MNIQAKLEKRVNKLGKPYTCVVLKLCEGVDRLVFLTSAELKLLELSSTPK